MLKIQTLSSGSRGNITYVAGDNAHILVDVGLTLSATLKRLADASVDPKTIDAILITHEHSDHILGVAAFAKRFGTPVYCHRAVRRALQKHIEIEEFIEFDAEFSIGGISVNFFQIPHDSKFCFGYTFTAGDAAVGIATDIGKMTADIISHLAVCQVVVLESNHDIMKLRANTKYPYWLKHRIVGERGHLSNTECANAVLTLSHGNVGQVILAHLSEENNSPSIAYSAIKEFLHKNGVKEGSDIFIDVAPQHTVGNLYCIQS